jgi:hypothetical protein
MMPNLSCQKTTKFFSANSEDIELQERISLLRQHEGAKDSADDKKTTANNNAPTNNDIAARSSRRMSWLMHRQSSKLHVL